MDQTPSRRNSQGRKQVSQPRVARARNVAGRSFEETFPSVSTANPGRAPVQGTMGHQSAGSRSARYNGDASRTYGKNGADYREEYSGPSRRKNTHPILYATVIMVCTLGLVTLGLFMAPQLFGIFWKDMPNYGFMNGQLIAWDATRVNDYRSKRNFMARDTIFPGVYVDNIHVGNMTVDQAKGALQQSPVQSDNGFSLTVNIGNRSFPINSQLVPLTRNVDQVLEQAYALGRQNAGASTSATPFEQRLAATEELYKQNVFLTSHTSYDKAAVRALTDEMVNRLNRDPVDATVKTFEFSTKKFTFTDEAVGVKVDGEALYQQVIAKLDAREYGQTITFTPEVINPKVTKVELMNNFKRVSWYTTETTNNANRNTNVDLAAKAINGHTVLPGQLFSFNETTGQRTEEKGYKEAIAISGGQAVPDIGGGVCQTSSTLFNAVARADLEIVDRSPHAWPSSYVQKGLDATVNWPSLDFKFRNNKDTPIFIISYYNDRKMTVEIYGMSLGDGVSIDLTSEVVRTVKPPSDVKYVQNTNLAPGTSKETIEARTGYVVDTYKVWYRNGQEFKREKMFTSNYRAFQKTVEYN
jgi:vancomycin resistance protein YoaR